jgi:hypothetical protein
MTNDEIKNVKDVMNDGARIDRLLLRSHDGSLYTSDSDTDGTGFRSPSVRIPVAWDTNATDEDAIALADELANRE